MYSRGLSLQSASCTMQEKQYSVGATCAECEVLWQRLYVGHTGDSEAVMACTAEHADLPLPSLQTTTQQCRWRLGMGNLLSVRCCCRGCTWGTQETVVQ